MKAILLAAAQDPRLHPFSETRTAALMPVGNRPAIFHTLNALPASIDTIVVVGPSDGSIGRAIGDEHAGRPIHYFAATDGNLVHAVAERLAGSGEAALLLGAADTHAQEELEQLGTSPGLLVAEAKDICGVGTLATAGGARRAVAAAVLDRDSLARATGEGASTFLASLVISDTSGLSMFTANAWRPMIYPWHLLEANVACVRGLPASDIRGTVEEGATLVGTVVVGEGSVIKSGTRIEGPVMIGRDCVIGPSAYLRPDTVVGDNCTLGHAFEIYDAVILPNTTGKHRSYVGHSVIGEDVNIGCGMITSDYRHDAGKHVTIVNGRKVQTGRSKLGAFIGDHVRTGIQTLFYPGRKLRAGASTRPGEIIERDC